MDLETLLRLLGVANASDAALAIERMNQMLSELQRITGQQTSQGVVQTVTQVFTALGGTGPEAVARLQGMQTALQRVPELEQQVTTMRREAEGREAAELMREASEDGRLQPSARETAERFYQEHGLASLRAFLSVLPRSNVSSEPPRQRPLNRQEQTGAPGNAESDEELTPEELRVGELMGRTPAELRAAKRLWTESANKQGEARVTLAHMMSLDRQVVASAASRGRGREA